MTWLLSVRKHSDRKARLCSLDLFFQIRAIAVCDTYIELTRGIRLDLWTHPTEDQLHRDLHRVHELESGMEKSDACLPKGISISSAMPSIPMNVNETIVTMGTVAQPSSLTRVKGRAKRYSVTHCLR
jgi:hypothetical protein